MVVSKAGEQEAYGQNFFLTEETKGWGEKSQEKIAVYKVGMSYSERCDDDFFVS